MADNTNNTRVITGAKARIFRGTQHVGNATGVNATITYQNQRVDVLGNPYSVTIVKVGVVADCSAEFVHIKDDETLSGLTPGPDGFEVVNWQAYDLHLVDASDSNKNLGTVVGATPRTKTVGGNARGIFMRNLAWDAINYREPNQ